MLLVAQMVQSKANNIRSGISGKSVMIRSGDFRFDPDTGWIEPTSGPSQYGRVRDDWGNWFGVHNSHPLWHYVLPAPNTETVSDPVVLDK